MSSIEQQLNELIANMTPEQIRKVMTQVKTNGPVKVDSRYKARRIAITELYHKSAPKPHQLDDFADYLCTLILSVSRWFTDEYRYSKGFYQR